MATNSTANLPPRKTRGGGKRRITLPKSMVSPKKKKGSEATIRGKGEKQRNNSRDFDDRDSDTSSSSGGSESEGNIEQDSGSNSRRPPRVINTASPGSSVSSNMSRTKTIVSTNTEFIRKRLREKVDDRDHKTVLTDLKNCFRKTFYSGVKFVQNDRWATIYLNVALKNKEVKVPSTLTITEFMALYQNKVYKAFSDLRHNSQVLARKHFLGTWKIATTVFYKYVFVSNILFLGILEMNKQMIWKDKKCLKCRLISQPRLFWILKKRATTLFMKSTDDTVNKLISLSISLSAYWQQLVRVPTISWVEGVVNH